MENQEIQTVQSGIAIRFTDTGIAEMREQRVQFENFVKDQLKDKTDFGILPGTKTPSLWKPGAEKLASLFQLGSRIVSSSKEIDIAKNWAMFTYCVELFHIPSGKPVSQCEAISNSQELKYREKKKWKNGQQDGTEPQLVGDLLNTLAKMCQKRAYVGAVIVATKASDFFNHDLSEDEEEFYANNPNYHAEQSKAQEQQRQAVHNENNKPAPQSKATEGSFDNFAGGGFKTPPKDTVLDPEEASKKASLREVAAERARLQWTPDVMGKYITENFGKLPNLLGADELATLVIALKRTAKK
jgi:hypothetical protein